MLFQFILGHFWCSVVTSVTFSSNLITFEKNPKKSIKSKKNPQKAEKCNNLQRTKNIQINQENPIKKKVYIQKNQKN